MLRFAAGLSRANGYNFTNRVLALSAAVAAALTGAAAVAASSDADISGIEEIVVTANKFARNLTDKRAQVSAINSSQDPDALLTVRPRTVGVNLTRKF